MREPTNSLRNILEQYFFYMIQYSIIILRNNPSNTNSSRFDYSYHTLDCIHQNMNTLTSSVNPMVPESIYLCSVSCTLHCKRFTFHRNWQNKRFNKSSHFTHKHYLILEDKHTIFLSIFLQEVSHTPRHI